jgi:hypothetical protein
MSRNGSIAAVIAVVVVVALAFWLFDFGEPTQEAQLPETGIETEEMGEGMDGGTTEGDRMMTEEPPGEPSAVTEEEPSGAQ